MQLIRRGLSDFAIFKELTVPLTVFSVVSPDESETKLNHTRGQHHHLFGLFNTPAQIDLSRYIVDDYIGSDPTTPKSSDTGNNEKDFLTYLLNCSESDENVRCKFFWLLRSSAIASCIKHRSNQDPRTGKRPVGDDSYYLVEALISFVARLVLTKSEEDLVSQHHADMSTSPSGRQQKETVSRVLESLAVLFAPLAAAIRSHDDLAAMWAILLNNASGGVRHTCTAVGTDSSSRTNKDMDEVLPADGEEASTKCLKAASIEGDSILSGSKEDGEDVDEEPWRDVTPPCSLLKASTVLLLCGGLPENDHDYRCSSQLLLTRLDFARPFLSSKQQAALSDALTRPSSRNRHRKRFVGSESGDTTQPPLRTISLSVCLESFTSQCRLISAVWVATEGLRSGFSLPESCVRRNERFRESLRSSIGEGFFLQSSGAAGVKILGPGYQSSSSAVSGGCSDLFSQAAEEPPNSPQMNSLQKNTKIEKDNEEQMEKSEDKEREKEREKDLALDVQSELRADQPGPEAGMGMTPDPPFWPLPSPLHPASVLLTGLDISKVNAPALTIPYSLFPTICSLSP